MQTPLNASASTAGALLSNTMFEIPPFQREYSWGKDEVADFWEDLSNSLDSESYFLGLIILTEGTIRKSVVDGQQRLITVTLLANAIYHEALARGRKALAERIQADFLRAINYDTDETNPRIELSDTQDNEVFQAILNTGKPPQIPDRGSVTGRIAETFEYLSKQLNRDIAADPFKRLGKWTRFLTDRLYFAVFVHPDDATAYQVFEVINTRGKELTTADLLKNYVLSQTSIQQRNTVYDDWKLLQRSFSADGTNSFVQFIRHSVTVDVGHIPPKDLFEFLANRRQFVGKGGPTVPQLIESLKSRLPLYLQMIDPSLDGPAEAEALRVFSALDALGVIAVRPIMLAIANVPESLEGMKYILRLVVRRIVVGNLGTGNVERRFGEAARKVRETNNWNSIVPDFRDLDPSRADFERQLRSRSFNKGVLTFLRRSVVQKTITPDQIGTLHYIWTRQVGTWSDMTEEDGSYWGSTIGNTILAESERRPKNIDSWQEFKNDLLPCAVEGEFGEMLSSMGTWNAGAVEMVGTKIAEIAGRVWYDE